ncbi:hypothetical protein CAPTEDRAFT_191631 [Capitella teleta]|uniref:Uncharacterized protein n=1 Tax=Capitella teleta TaxID=283909 RepID=R7TFI6_CAPTE|nr:hypothetical protein CAPTEDRAFT_191631 [Capitella teleta]|eukprot:ELT89791.1 hypothetical protein CAPTEDRAFT_191631 [Capitella teleta]
MIIDNRKYLVALNLVAIITNFGYIIPIGGHTSSEDDDVIFREKVFDELRSNIGNTNDFRIFQSLDLVQEFELSSQLTKRALQRTTLDNPVLIFVLHLTSKEDFALQCESPDVSIFNRQSLEADYQLACDCLAFLYVMQNRLKLYRQRVHVTQNVLEKIRSSHVRKYLLENGRFKFENIENIFDEIYSYETRFGDMSAMECAIEQMKEVYNVMKSDRKQEIIRDEDSQQEHDYTRSQMKEILKRSHMLFRENVEAFKSLTHQTKYWLKTFYTQWMKNAPTMKKSIESMENHHGNQKRGNASMNAVLKTLPDRERCVLAGAGWTFQSGRFTQRICHAVNKFLLLDDRAIDIKVPMEVTSSPFNWTRLIQLDNFQPTQVNVPEGHGRLPWLNEPTDIIGTVALGLIIITTLL